jgi:hypothetical protein
MGARLRSLGEARELVRLETFQLMPNGSYGLHIRSCVLIRAGPRINLLIPW